MLEEQPGGLIFTTRIFVQVALNIKIARWNTTTILRRETENIRSYARCAQWSFFVLSV